MTKRFKRFLVIAIVFAITFFIWFITKIVFLKEAKKYKDLKKYVNEKNK